MVGREPLTEREWRIARQFVWAVVCLLPAFFIGLHIGSLASSIGSHRDFASVLSRGGVCGVVPAVFALLSPRFCIVPSAIYAFGVLGGYGLSAAIVDSMSALFLPLAVFSGERSVAAVDTSHSEGIWVFVIALWMVLFTLVRIVVCRSM